MNKRIIGLAMVMTAVVCVCLGDEPVRKQRPTQPFMRQKLDYARGILEGITLERYDLVITNATSLRDMALKNFFLTMGNQPYRVAITNFQTRVDGLLQAANEKNLEASSEAYTRVIRGCIECHKQFRLPQFRPEEK
jgi:hypothetical protein